MKRRVLAKFPDVPASFLAFCAWLGVTLTPAQSVLTAVAYDGIEPGQLRGEWREIADKIFGDLRTIPPECRSVIVALCGARGGKSYILGALRILHLSLTVNLDGLAPGEAPTGLILAPKLKLAQQTFRYAVGAVANKPELLHRLYGQTKESFVLRRDHGREVVVQCLPASRGGDAVRARYYVGANLDEFAFFRDGNFEINDAELFRAVTPRIMPGGQTVLTSTAWARMGLMHKLFSDNWQHPMTCLAIKAPTVLLNPSKRAEVAVEIKRDAMNAAREFGCEFMDAAAGTFFSHAAIDDAQDRTMVLPLKPTAGVEVMIGADTGFRRDSSAIVAVYLYPDGTYRVAELLELRPTPGAPLKPSDVISAFARFCKRHGCSELMADGHYRETLDEELAKERLSYVPAPGGAEGKAECHMQAKTILHGGMLKIPASETDGDTAHRLIEQMKTLIGRPTSGGGMTFQMPRTTSGGHGDLLSALVLALCQKSGRKVIPAEEKVMSEEDWIRKQTKDAFDKQEQRRLDALYQKHEEDEIAGPFGRPAEREPWYVQ